MPMFYMVYGLDEARICLSSVPDCMLGEANCFLTPALYLAHRYENTSS